MPRVSGWLVVAVAALAYPLLVLVFSGAPAFPSRTDCVVAPTGEGEYRVVFGYRDSELEARGAARPGTRGRVSGHRDLERRVRSGRVAVDDIPSREVGEEVIRQARTVDLDPTLEQES